MVILVLFYLSTMCVTKYNSILSCHVSKTDHSEGPERSNSTPALGGSSTLGQRETPDSAAEEVEGFSSSTAGSVPAESQDTPEQIEASMEVVGPFLCELLLEHRALLSKVLVAANGRLLISDGKGANGKILMESELAVICIESEIQYQGVVLRMTLKTLP